MGDILRSTLNRISVDLKKNFVPLSLIFGAWAIMTIVFHRFCPVVLFCGFPCPGCGMTRAFFSFFTLHPIRAFFYNPVYPLWLITLISAAFRRYIQGKSLVALRPLLIITALATIAIYIWRMIYVFPNHEPMTFFHKNLMSTLFPSYDNFITTHIR